MIEKIVDMYDEPFADSSAIPNYIVSRLASQSVKVVLSGDGGDEFFGGYSLYQRYLKIHKYKNLIRFGKPLLNIISDLMPENMKGKRFLSSLTHDPELFFAYTMQIYEKEKKSFFHPEIYHTIMENQALEIKLAHYNTSTTTDYASRMMEIDISTYMVDDILTKVDRVSMANSLEVRVPIIDHVFFNVAAKIPSFMKINGSTGKYIFREAMRAYIPNQVYKKSKSGFTIPIAQWFKKDLSDYFVDILARQEDTGIINPDYINNILQHENLGSFSTRVWPLVVFIIWLEKIHNRKDI
jgi:asparagine synthase (glutamine-hydrolysing)